MVPARRRETLLRRRAAGGRPEKGVSDSKFLRAVPSGRPPAQAGQRCNQRPRCHKAPHAAGRPLASPNSRRALSDSRCKPQRVKTHSAECRPALTGRGGKLGNPAVSYCLLRFAAASAAMPHAATQQAGARRKPPRFLISPCRPTETAPCTSRDSAVISARAAIKPRTSPDGRHASPDGRCNSQRVKTHSAECWPALTGREGKLGNPAVSYCLLRFAAASAAMPPRRRAAAQQATNRRTAKCPVQNLSAPSHRDGPLRKQGQHGNFIPAPP